MKIFLDSADIGEITTLCDTGFVDGITTNPSLIAKSGRNILETISTICEMVDGPVSAEVAATDFETMLAEGRKLAGLAPNVTVKVPLTEAGLQTCRALSDVAELGKGVGALQTLQHLHLDFRQCALRDTLSDEDISGLFLGLCAASGIAVGVIVTGLNLWIARDRPLFITYY